MKDFRIIFNGTEQFALPDGIDLGIVGEHNAVRLVITLPNAMVDSIDYHVVTIGGVQSALIVDTDPNADGAYRVGNTIYQPLTAYYTTERIVDLSVTAYKQTGDTVEVIDKTPTVYGLRFNGGTPLKMPGGLAAEVAALARKVAQLKGIETVQTLPESPEADTIVYLDDVGIYHYTGTEWEQLTDNGAGLSGLEQLIDAIRQDLPTAEEIERWNAAAAARHSHENKPSLDKLLVSASYAALPSNADNGSVGVVTGIDGTSKPVSQYDPATDADTPMTIAESLAYDAQAVLGNAVLVIDGTTDEIAVGMIPVYTQGASSPVYGGLDMFFSTGESDPKKYMIFVSPQESVNVEAVLADCGVEVPSGAEIDALFFVHAFEDADGVFVAEGEPISGTLSAAEGWNVCVFAEEEEALTVALSPVRDPNLYCAPGLFDSVSIPVPQHPFLYDVLRLETSQDKRGIYHKTDGEWVRFYGAELDDLADRLSIVEHGKPDDVTLLGFEPYSALVVRDEAVTGESIQDVPVFVQGGEGVICSLYEYTSDPVGLGYDDGVELVDIRQFDTGMPLFVLAVTVGGVRYAYYPQDYNGGLAGMVYAGWNVNNQPSDPPTITSFTPDRFSFGGVTYDDLDDLPDAAKSALRSLSQCVNVSADAMGTIRVPDDAVTRFAGTFEPNRKYAFATGNDCTFALPSVPFAESEAQFVLYLTCTADVDLTFPPGTRFAGGTAPNSDAGSHKLIGCWLKDAGAWAIGGVDYEVQS